ncbi:MAG: methylated-DNA--[protein]-cysteine S-methyltransferase [Pirellulales bacterium]
MSRTGTEGRVTAVRADRPNSDQLVAWSPGRSAAAPHWGTSWAIATPLGWIGWTMSSAGLRQLRFGYRTLEELAQSQPANSVAQLNSTTRSTSPPPVAHTGPDSISLELADQLRRFVAGERVDFAGIPCDLEGMPEFGRRVLAACQSIAWGEVWTYGQLAGHIGAPQAARAVGAALGRNPIPLVIPCHRVVGGTGRLVGFSAPGGISTKVRLLELEGHHPTSDRMPHIPSPR